MKSKGLWSKKLDYYKPASPYELALAINEICKINGYSLIFTPKEINELKNKKP